MEPVLLVCADLHGSKETIALLEEAERELSPDAIIVCGDLTTYGSRSFMSMLLKALETDLLAVPGNCDTTEMLSMLEDAGASVHGCRRSVGRYQAYGFGGGLPSPSNMPFEVAEHEMVSALRSIAVEGGILVTHTPPLGANDSADSGRHLGSEGIMSVVRDFKPVLALSGHVHEARGELRKDGTVFVNPGPARGGYYARVQLGQDIEVELLKSARRG